MYGLRRRSLPNFYPDGILSHFIRRSEQLLGKQAVRIYRYFFCEENYSQIARSEGVDESTVRRSIERGLIQLRKKLFGTGISTDDFAIRSHTRYVKHFHPKKEAADRQSQTSSFINMDEGGVANGE